MRLLQNKSFICAAHALAVCAMVSALSLRAHAQAEDAATAADASTIAAARVLAVDGVKLAQSGHCDEAIEKLERAQALHHAPIVLEQLGECYIAEGKIVAGTEALRAVLREPMPAQPSAAMRRAYTRAQAALDAAKPKIAQLTIQLTPADIESPRVAVDGQAVPSALLGIERPTDPGEHVVEASAPGYRAERARVSLLPGDSQLVKFQLEPDLSAQAQARDDDAQAPSSTPTPREVAAASSEPVSVARSNPQSRTTSANAPDRTAAYIAWVVAGAGLAVGAGFGIAALDAKNDLDSRCPNDRCGPDQADALDGAKRDGVVSTVGFSVGAAAAVLGTVLFLMAGDEERTTAHASDARGSL